MMTDLEEAADIHMILAEAVRLQTRDLEGQSGLDHLRANLTDDQWRKAAAGLLGAMVSLLWHYGREMQTKGPTFHLHINDDGTAVGSAFQPDAAIDHLNRWIDDWIITVLDRTVMGPHDD